MLKYNHMFWSFRYSADMWVWRYVTDVFCERYLGNCARVKRRINVLFAVCLQKCGTTTFDCCVRKYQPIYAHTSHLHQKPFERNLLLLPTVYLRKVWLNIKYLNSIWLPLPWLSLSIAPTHSHALLSTYITTTIKLSTSTVSTQTLIESCVYMCIYTCDEHCEVVDDDNDVKPCVFVISFLSSFASYAVVIKLRICLSNTHISRNIIVFLLWLKRRFLS